MPFYQICKIHDFGSVWLVWNIRKQQKKEKAATLWRSEVKELTDPIEFISAEH